MLILVTRPEPDNRVTATKLHALGHEVLLAPMLRFETLPFDIDSEDYAGIVVSSANALRAISLDAALPQLLPLPLYAVGDHTADVARGLGFRDVHSADGDARALADLVASSVVQGGAPLLYLAAEIVSVDLAAQLSKSGIATVTKTVYRMNPVAAFPRPVVDAFGDADIAAVLHFSQRSALVFVQASRAAGLEVSALGVPQLCISSHVAQALREAGASQAAVAAAPTEDAVLALLGKLSS